MLKTLAIGHLGKDCVVNNVSGKTVINFTLAHTEKYKKEGETVEKTTWLDCAYWSDKTAIAAYLTKGKLVYVEGTPEINTFTRQDGTAGASFKLRVMTVQLLSGGEKPAGAGAGAQQPAATQQQPAGGYEPIGPQGDIGDLPF